MHLERYGDNLSQRVKGLWASDSKLEKNKSLGLTASQKEAFANCNNGTELKDLKRALAIRVDGSLIETGGTLSRINNPNYSEFYKQVKDEILARAKKAERKSNIDFNKRKEVYRVIHLEDASTYVGPANSENQPNTTRSSKGTIFKFFTEQDIKTAGDIDRVGELLYFFHGRFTDGKKVSGIELKDGIVTVADYDDKESLKGEVTRLYPDASVFQGPVKVFNQKVDLYSTKDFKTLEDWPALKLRESLDVDLSVAHGKVYFNDQNGFVMDANVEQNRITSGVVKTVNCYTFKGKFRDGIAYEGVLARPSGIVDIGKFLPDSKPDGKVTRIYQDGTQLTANWSEGELDRSDVTVVFADDSTYKGSLNLGENKSLNNSKNLRRFKEGTFVIDDNTTISGTWNQAKPLDAKLNFLSNDGQPQEVQVNNAEIVIPQKILGQAKAVSVKNISLEELLSDLKEIYAKPVMNYSSEKQRLISKAEELYKALQNDMANTKSMPICVNLDFTDSRIIRGMELLQEQGLLNEEEQKLLEVLQNGGSYIDYSKLQIDQMTVQHVKQEQAKNTNKKQEPVKLDLGITKPEEVEPEVFGPEIESQEPPVNADALKIRAFGAFYESNPWRVESEYISFDWSTDTGLFLKDLEISEEGDCSEKSSSSAPRVAKVRGKNANLVSKMGLDDSRKLSEMHQGQIDPESNSTKSAPNLASLKGQHQAISMPLDDAVTDIEEAEVLEDYVPEKPTLDNHDLREGSVFAKFKQIIGHVADDAILVTRLRDYDDLDNKPIESIYQGPVRYSRPNGKGFAVIRPEFNKEGKLVNFKYIVEGNFKAVGSDIRYRSLGANYPASFLGVLYGDVKFLAPSGHLNIGCSKFNNNKKDPVVVFKGLSANDDEKVLELETRNHKTIGTGKTWHSVKSDVLYTVENAQDEVLKTVKKPDFVLKS